MKVKRAHLQSAVVLPGVKTTEETLSEQRTPGIRMEMLDHGLLVTIKEEQAFIPSTNVKIMILDQQDPVPRGTSKKG